MLLTHLSPPVLRCKDFVPRSLLGEHQGLGPTEEKRVRFCRHALQGHWETGRTPEAICKSSAGEHTPGDEWVPGMGLGWCAFLQRFLSASPPPPPSTLRPKGVSRVLDEDLTLVLVGPHLQIGGAVWFFSEPLERGRRALWGCLLATWLLHGLLWQL